MLIRKFLPAGALVLAAMCLAVPGHADVGLVLDEPASIDPAVGLAIPIVADLPGSGDSDDADDVQIVAFCAVAPRLLDGDPMRIDDPGWCPLVSKLRRSGAPTAALRPGNPG